MKYLNNDFRVVLEKKEREISPELKIKYPKEIKIKKKLVSSIISYMLDEEGPSFTKDSIINGLGFYPEIYSPEFGIILDFLNQEKVIRDFEAYGERRYCVNQDIAQTYLTLLESIKKRIVRIKVNIV